MDFQDSKAAVSSSVVSTAVAFTPKVASLASRMTNLMGIAVVVAFVAAVQMARSNPVFTAFALALCVIFASAKAQYSQNRDWNAQIDQEIGIKQGQIDVFKANFGRDAAERQLGNLTTEARLKANIANAKARVAMTHEQIERNNVWLPIDQRTIIAMN